MLQNNRVALNKEAGKAFPASLSKHVRKDERDRFYVFDREKGRGYTIVIHKSGGGRFMKKKIISLAAVISMIITLVMPAAVYADEPQEESTAVLKYSVLTSDSEEWKEVTGGETAGTAADDAAEITKLKLNVSDSKSQEDQKTVSYAVADTEGTWSDYTAAGQEASNISGKAVAAVKAKVADELAEKYDIYYRAYVKAEENAPGKWLGWAKNDQVSGVKGYDCGIKAIQFQLVEKDTENTLDTANPFLEKKNETPEEPTVPTEPETTPKVVYQAHVAKIGWQKEVEDGALAGTEGRALTIEALKIKLDGLSEEEQKDSKIVYKTHVQTYGWQNEVANGALSGTTGKAKRVEAVAIHLEGAIADKYDVYYRTHVQSFGWLDWAKNGEKAGSSTYGKRLEAIQIKLVKKGESAPGSTTKAYQSPRIQYQTHVQSYGWQSKVSDNQIAGTTGKGKRVEAIKITLPDSDYTGNVEYQAFVQGIGWQTWKKNGELAGTSGQSKRIEALRVKLTGEIANYYEVYYSVHLAKIGWCNYESAGNATGTIDLSKKIEALKICLVKKGVESAPDTSGVKYVEGYKSGNFYYNGTIKGAGATGNVAQGGTVGTIGKKQQLQSLNLHLDQSNKLAPSGTIQYSTHISSEGWKDWSNAGTTNGASNASKGMEAVKIRLTGDLAKYYDIYYRAHVQGYGWLGWAKNGQVAGTSKIGYRMEGLQIRLVSKDASAPGKNANYYTEKKKAAAVKVTPKDQMHLKALSYASNTQYLILVDTSANKVGIYSGSVGKWNQIQKYTCTSGARSTPTVKGTFTVQGKGKSFGSGYTCWYYTQFYGNYLFHSVIYKQGSMSVITDGRLGINASHGCVRLNINHAKWIYDHIPRGTKVVVY